MYDVKEFGITFGLTGIYKQRVLFKFYACSILWILVAGKRCVNRLYFVLM